MQFPSYFSVFGPRLQFDEDGKPTGYTEPPRPRFASVYENQAVDFAQGVYRRENIILEIHEHNIRDEQLDRQFHQE